MSGGAFDYIQFRLDEVLDRIKDEVSRNEKVPYEHPQNMWEEEENQWFDEHGRRIYREETIEAFKKGYKAIMTARAYMQRIDWLLSGDDGEENFLERLKADLDTVEKEFDLTDWENENEDDDN